MKKGCFFLNQKRKKNYTNKVIIEQIKDNSLAGKWKAFIISKILFV